MKYRPEIDGLRAIAVVPVVLFHAGFVLFRGGFVGVDVFFVISGYLITTVIVDEVEQGKFTITSFYERRARRILPALFLVLFTTVPFAWLWMWPGALKNFFESLISVVAFLSNVFFWRERGYFDAVSELKPLLHTWSLAVEEQFYLLFPLLLVLFWRYGRRNSILILTVGAGISFGLAEWASIHRPGAGFYLIVTRAWELLLGSLAALYLGRRSTNSPEIGRALKEAAAAAGLASITISVFAFDSFTPFPGRLALLPTIGSVLIILFADQTTFVGKALSKRVIVGIGLISYSVYLWHQPLLAFARTRAVGELELSTVVLICIAVFPISYLSWRFVETPFRKRSLFSRRQILGFALIGSVALLAIGVAGYKYSYLGRKLPPNIQWEDLGRKIETLGDVCTTQPADGFPEIEICYFGDTAAATTVALYGDSHARAISWALDRELKARGLRGVRVIVVGCETVPTVVETRAVAFLERGQCEKGFSSMIDFLKRKVSEIIVSSRWTYFLYPIEGEIASLSFDNREGGFERNTESRYGVLLSDGELSLEAEDKRNAVRSFLRSLAELDMRVTIVYPVPEVGWDVAKLNAEHYDRTGSSLENISTSQDLYRERNRFVLGVLNEFAGDPKLRFLKPEDIFCNTFIPGRCVAQWNSVPFYDDDDHLSDVGSKMLIDKIFAGSGDR